ncbi:PAS domain S-box protein [candidate division KSB1 bacterium]|nr:PAS domain S-box protein [candidate division KSB1 bacterium]
MKKFSKQKISPFKTTPIIVKLVSLGFILGYFLPLVGATMDDFVQGTGIASSLSEIHHHIGPLIIGLIGSILGFLFGQIYIKHQYTQEEFNQSQNLFQLMFDNANIGRAIANIEGRFIKVNQSFCTMTGYTEKELITMSWQDIIHHEFLKPSSEKVTRLLISDKNSTNTIQKIIHKKGQVIWVNLNIVIKRDTKASPLFLIGDIEDITERKKAEEALRDSEEKFRTIVSNAQAVIFVVDREGTFLLSEGRGLTALGLKPGQVVGLSAFDLYKDYPKIKNGIKKALAGTFHTKEIKVGDMYFDTFYSPYKNADNEIIGVIGMSIDITERKLAEDALKKSEEKYRDLFEKSIDAICIVNKNGNFIDINKATETLTGYSRAELMKKQVMELVHPDDREKSSEFFEKLYNEGSYQDYESRIITRNGDLKYIHVNANLIYDKNDQIVGSRDIIRDITSRKQAENKVLKSLREKELLLKEIHHRVKNNLQIIISLLNLQASRIQDEQTLKAYQESKNRIYAMALVHEKLYQTADFSEIHFKGYIESMIRELYIVYKTSSLVSIDLQIDDISISIDKAIPCGLIINEILTNSLKHAFPNGRKGNIVISFTRLRNQWYELNIKDNGIGIPKNINIRETNSLGLQLIRILTQQIDGSVTIERDKGTAFNITFKN